MNVLRSKRAAAGLGAALVTLVGLTLFVVLPALASNPNDRVPPASVAPSGLPPTGLIPVDMAVGGNGSCSNLFTSAVSKLPNLREYDNVNPGTGTGLSSGNGDGVTFNTTVTGSSKSQVMQIGSTKAAIAAVGINGGADSTAYDYTGLSSTPGVLQGWVTADGNLHAPASKYTVSGGIETPSQWYSISHLTVCYRVLAPISGAVFNDANGTGTPAGQSGIGGVAVTIIDNTTHGRTTVTTGTDGTFNSPQPVGDSYTVCSASPGAGYQQTAPTPSSTSCPGGLTGYTVTGGNATNYFGFQSNSTISGRVYADADESGTFNTGDAAQPWVVKLFEGANTTAVATTTADGNGVYTLKAPLKQNSQYTVCEIPASGIWAQGVPSPKSGDVCKTLAGLPKGYTVTGTSSVQNITGDDFANVAAVTCPGDQNANGVDYSVSLDCTKAGQTYVQSAGVLNGKPFVRLWAGDQTLGSPAPMIEQITWPYTSANQNQITVDYTDIYPFDTTKVHAMRFCQRDPSTDVAAWDPSKPLPANVLQPADATVDPESTSCLISTSISVRTHTYVAVVYSAVDGLRNQQ